MEKKLTKIIAKGIIKTRVLLIGTGSFILTPITAFAEEVGNSKLATGTQELVGDLTTWLMILAPTVTVLLVVYYLIRKSASDEMDGKKWNSRITVALVSCIGAVLASVIVNILIGYYQ
jgi:hypothetical protein